jgi:2'-5' RNA ligase
LRKISAKGKKHRLPIEQSRYWPHNRIVWVGPDSVPDPLGSLAADLREELAEKSFKTETRAFAAHITLIRKARDPGELPPLPAVEWPVEELVLVRSRLSPEGSRYEVLERYPLS